MERSFKNRKRFLLIPFGIAALLALISFIVMQLWNNLLPGILHVGTITFWQALGIFILCKILFGFGKGGKAPWMDHKMGARFKQMSSKEKECFKEKMECRMSRWKRDEPDQGGASDAYEA